MRDFGEVRGILSRMKLQNILCIFLVFRVYIIYYVTYNISCLDVYYLERESMEFREEFIN